MIVHYLFLGDMFNVIFLLQEYFMMIQYSLVFYYFVSQLIETFKILIKLYQVKTPLILLNVLMLTGFALYTGISLGLNEPLYNCNNGIWVYLHVCNFSLSIIFAAIGCKADEILKNLKNTQELAIDYDKIRQFWYFLYRIIIKSMMVASAVNLGESIFFIGITNSNCYSSYSNNLYADLVIFCLIRFTSHYIFMLGCLYIFRVQRITKIKSILLNENDRSILIASYYDDDNFVDISSFHINKSQHKYLK